MERHLQPAGMSPAFLTAVLVASVALSLPAAIRAFRIFGFHRRLGSAAWPFVIVADTAVKRVEAPGRAGRGGGPGAWTTARARGVHHGRRHQRRR